MIQYQLKLRPGRAVERQLDGWLWNLTGAWNWAVGQIKHDPALSHFDLCQKTAGHASKIGLPAVVLQATLADVAKSWRRCFKGVARRPRLKGARRKLNSIPLKDPIRLAGNRAALPLLGKVRYHKQTLPQGRIKSGRLVKRASGWYLCLFIDADRQPIARRGSGAVGIDPGFSTLLTLSNGEKIGHPQELRAGAERLAKAQRGHDAALAARLQERIANRKKDRNHQLSLRLVQDFSRIYFSKDNLKGMSASLFGKSVSASNHYQLRQMLRYKSLAGGTEFVEVDSKFSTRTCSVCGALAGPAGLAGLSVRHWECTGCGAQLDRDVNAAVNTLSVGAGRALEARAA
jgi:transposase